MKRFLHIIVIVAMLISTLPLFSLPVSANGDTQAICVPWQPSNHAIAHYTYDGKEITLKGIARGDAAEYYWDYGDGSPAMAWTAISNPYNLGVKHTYSGIPGQLFIATLHVKNTTGDVEVSDTYPVKVYLSTDEGIPSHEDVRINIAIDEGLWFLHTNMTRNTYGAGEPGYGQPYGYWNYNGEGGDYTVASTGASVDAFQLHGSKANGDYDGDPYVETVQRALNYLLTYAFSFAIDAETAGNPDTNGNGIGIVINYSSSISNNRQTYIGGICMVALASSGAPARVATTGRANVYGRTYADIVQDMADFFAWGQNDAEDGNYRGGWRYYANSNDSDLSTTQWPVLGLTAAEANMGTTIPAWVKTELAYFIEYIRYKGDCGDNDCGAYGYNSPTSYLNVLKAASAIICYQFMGTPMTDPKVQMAMGYMYRHWNDTGSSWDDTRIFFNSYSMYAIMKSMRNPEPDILRIYNYDCCADAQTADSFDWYYKPTGQANDGIAYRLVNNQQADGQWDDTVGSNPVYNAFSTGWGVLILMKGVSIIPPVAEICDCGQNEYDLNQDIPLDASCSYHPDPGKSIVSYEWDFDNDGAFDDATGMNVVLTGGFPDAGYHPVRLRVTDNNPAGAGGPQTDIYVCEIYVHPPCLNPNADAGGPYIGWIGEMVQLDGTGTFDPDTAYGELTFEWDLDNDGEFDDATGDQPQYSWPGAYHGVIGLKVSDSGCTVTPPGEWYTGWDIDYAIVDISDNHPPVADAGGPYVAAPNETITLDGTGSYDPDAGDEITYAWDLDNDGEFDDSTDPQPSFTAGPTPGTVHTVCLKVTDPDSEYDIDCANVTVSMPTTTPGPEVGGDIYPMDKMTLLPLWIIGSVALVTGVTVLVIWRRRTQT